MYDAPCPGGREASAAPGWAASRSHARTVYGLYNVLIACEPGRLDCRPGFLSQAAGRSSPMMRLVGATHRLTPPRRAE
jgi:hypothetical protein